MRAHAEPVDDWATDFDHLDPAYVADPYAIWDELRQRCPVAHTDRYHGVYLPTRYRDIAEVAYDTETYSSRTVVVNQLPPEENRFVAPPITLDPPLHTPARRALLPVFSPQKITTWEPVTRETANRRIDTFVDRGRCDAARDYAQHIPITVIARMLGIPEEDGDTFTRWIHELLEEGPGDLDVSRGAGREVLDYLIARVEEHRAEPRDDIITYLLGADLDGRPVDDRFVLGTLFLLLVAGIDTTWSVIGSSLWHLASHPADRRRLVAEPDLVPTAAEEFLRAFSPVTMARYVARDAELGGCPVKAGQRLLLPFPAGNRDPEVFEDAGKVVIDREVNRHFAFGLGIHRCLGSNLARMELRVALEEWLRRIPDFSLEDPDAVTWSAGQIRGPRTLPVVFGGSR